MRIILFPECAPCHIQIPLLLNLPKDAELSGAIIALIGHLKFQRLLTGSVSLPPKPLRYGKTEGGFAFWKEGRIMRTVEEGGAVGRFHYCALRVAHKEG